MKYSLVAGGPSGQHIRLQSGEEALLVAPLADLHVQQVGVQGGVVDLYDSHLDGFLWMRRTEVSGEITGCIRHSHFVNLP